MLLIIISIVAWYFIEALLYEIFMSTSGNIMGEYHCKSYFRYIVLYIGMFIICILIINQYSISTNDFITLNIGTIIVTIICCPVESINKEVSNVKKKKFKIYSLIYISM